MKQIKLELIWRRNGVIEEEGSGRSQIFRRLGALAHIWRQRGRWQWIWGNRRCVGCHPIPEPPCSHHTHTHTHTVIFNTIIHTPTYTTCNPRKGKEKKQKNWILTLHRMVLTCLPFLSTDQGSVPDVISLPPPARSSSDSSFWSTCSTEL